MKRQEFDYQNETYKCYPTTNKYNYKYFRYRDCGIQGLIWVTLFWLLNFIFLCMKHASSNMGWQDFGMYQEENTEQRCISCAPLVLGHISATWTSLIMILLVALVTTSIYKFRIKFNGII